MKKKQVWWVWVCFGFLRVKITSRLFRFKLNHRKIITEDRSWLATEMQMGFSLSQVATPSIITLHMTQLTVKNHPKKLDDVLSMSRSPLNDVPLLHVHSGGGIQPRVQPRLHDSECQQPRREAGDVPGASDTRGAGPSLSRSQGECPCHKQYPAVRPHRWWSQVFRILMIQDK